MTLPGFLLALLVLAALPIASPLAASERIPLRPHGGVYAVAVQINGALTIDFLLDTGAADVIIPADVALTLIRTGTIDTSDFLGSGQYTLADGSIVENTKINLRRLQIGSRVLHNVQGAVGGVESSLLLGQTALRHLEPWRLDTKTGDLVLMDPDTSGPAYAEQKAAPATMDERGAATVTPVPSHAPLERRKVQLNGWTANRNAAVIGSPAPGSRDGLGVNFPMDGEGARLVACSDHPALKGRSSVQIEINIDGTEAASGTANASPRSDTCWNAYIPTSTLRAIKNGAIMWVSLADRVYYRADLSGSAKAMNEAWAYVEERLPAQEK